jgi:hypothetical protein
MYPVLFLIAIVSLIYLIVKLSRSGTKTLSSGNNEIVKCTTCGLNLPKSDALEGDKVWYCSEEHKN